MMDKLLKVPCPKVSWVVLSLEKLNSVHPELFIVMIIKIRLYQVMKLLEKILWKELSVNWDNLQKINFINF